MDLILSHKINIYRRLSIRKDIIELSQWIDTIEDINIDIDHLKILENQLIKNKSLAANLFGLRRKNTLIMGVLCKYDLELKKEFEWSKREYDVTRAKEHEKKRDQYTELIQEYRAIKTTVFTQLMNYKRR